MYLHSQAQGILKINSIRPIQTIGEVEQQGRRGGMSTLAGIGAALSHKIRESFKEDFCMDHEHTVRDNDMLYEKNKDGEYEHDKDARQGEDALFRPGGGGLVGCGGWNGRHGL
jgi:hypothetical protein